MLSYIKSKYTQIVHLESTVEEAKDHIMMYVVYEMTKGEKSIMIALSETDILFCFLYDSTFIIQVLQISTKNCSPF